MVGNMQGLCKMTWRPAIGFRSAYALVHWRMDVCIGLNLATRRRTPTTTRTPGHQLTTDALRPL